MTEIGHNVGGVAADRLRSIVARIETLEEQRRGLAADIKDIMTEAKSAGFDPKVIRTLVAQRQKDQAEVDEQAALLEVYKKALGLLSDTPLGQAAMGRAS
jgi:uncharacterized protein (UPF0335 family)